MRCCRVSNPLKKFLAAKFKLINGRSNIHIQALKFKMMEFLLRIGFWRSMSINDFLDLKNLMLESVLCPMNLFLFCKT